MGRPGHVAEDGGVHKERSPQDLAAQALQHCDLMAWGRFVSVCDQNYHRTHVFNAEVSVKFAVEKTLFGEPYEFVRTRLTRQMLVWPDTNLSRTAHGFVSGRRRTLHGNAVADGQELLRGIYEAGLPMSREQYERLSGLLGQTSQQFSVSRKEIVAMMSKRTFISHGLNFLLEMGAVTPERPFLVGFSKPVDAAKGNGVDNFNTQSTMLFWSQEAEDVAEQIRVLSEDDNPKREVR